MEAVLRNTDACGLTILEAASLFFEVQEHRVVVIACFHGRRNPRRWQSR